MSSAADSQDNLENTRDRIRHAASRLFAQNGFEATGIRDIANAAEISTAGLYHYMDGKLDLLVDIMTIALQRLSQSTTQLLATCHTPAAELATLVKTHIANQILQRPASVITDTEIRVLTTKRRRNVVRFRDDYESLWTAALEAGRMSSSFTFEHITVTRLSLLEMCNGVSDWYREDGPLSIGMITDRVANLALATVEARHRNRRLHLSNLECPPTAHVIATVERICRGNWDVESSGAGNGARPAVPTRRSRR